MGADREEDEDDASDDDDGFTGMGMRRFFFGEEGPGEAGRETGAMGVGMIRFLPSGPVVNWVTLRMGMNAVCVSV